MLTPQVSPGHNLTFRTQNLHIRKNEMFTSRSFTDPGIFVRRGPGPSDRKKALTMFFLVFILVLNLFAESSRCISKITTVILLPAHPASFAHKFLFQ